MQEEWRTTYASDRHEVSNFGRVRSWAVRNHLTKRALSPKLMRPHLSDGYPYVHIGRRNWGVHTLVLHAFRGPPSPGQICRHLDGDRTNNVSTNLRWGTDLENKADALEHGTRAACERHGAAKLSPENVDEIRASSESHAALGRKFGVTDVCISKVRSRKTWAARP